MSGQFNVDHATLHTAANDVREVRSEIEGELGKLRAAADDLQHAWKGGAATGFQNLFNRWDQDARNLLQAMHDIADLLDTSATHHAANDEQQQQTLDRIHSVLNPS